jgi:hypothetical protein
VSSILYLYKPYPTSRGWETAVSNCLDGCLVIYLRMVSKNAVRNTAWWAGSRSRCCELRESSGGR